MFRFTDDGGLGIQISQIPITTPVNPQAQYYFVNQVTASSSVTQGFVVSNTSNAPMQVSIYPGAATNASGVFIASSVGVTNDLTSWVTVSPTSVLLPAHSHIEAHMTLAVPSGVASGERFGVIWAATNSSSAGSGISSTNRVGIRMYIPVETSSISTTTSSQRTVTWFTDHSDQFQWLSIVILAISLVALARRRLGTR